MTKVREFTHSILSSIDEALEGHRSFTAKAAFERLFPLNDEIDEIFGDRYQKMNRLPTTPERQQYGGQSISFCSIMEGEEPCSFCFDEVEPENRHIWFRYQRSDRESKADFEFGQPFLIEDSEFHEWDIADDMGEDYEIPISQNDFEALHYMVETMGEDYVMLEVDYGTNARPLPETGLIYEAYLEWRNNNG